MYLSEFYEDNAGYVFAVVINGFGDVLNVVRMPETIAPDDLKRNCKYGWPDADEYDPDDFSGKTPSDIYNEFKNDVDLIAELDGTSKPILFPDKMGIAGYKLFAPLLGVAAGGGDDAV